MHISYWAPFFDKIATIKAVKNSIRSLIYYSKETKKIELINFFGEWSGNEIENFENEKFNLINLFKKKNLIDLLPKNSFTKSRISYSILFIIGFFPLINYLRKKKPDYFVIHLISSLPLFVLILFNFKTKFILRISGLPKLTLFRKYLWKISNKKIYKITAPTQATLNYLKKNNIFDEKKLYLLRDPIISYKDKKKKLGNIKIKNFFLAIGRLTKQKNQKLLLEAFQKIYIKNKKKNYNLVILGEGELKKDLIDLSNKLNISKNVFFMGNVENVHEYISHSLCVISTSLWEDPGFVMIETAFSKNIIISSDCPNGPREFIEDNMAGYIFKNNDIGDLINKINLFLSDSEKNIFLKKKYAIMKSKNYTLFNHFKSLNKILNSS